MYKNKKKKYFPLLTIIYVLTLKNKHLKDPFKEHRKYLISQITFCIKKDIQVRDCVQINLSCIVVLMFHFIDT